MLTEYPKTEKDIEVITITDEGDFNKQDFLLWIDSPCDINLEIDNPFYEVIKYLNSYCRTTFETERYCFYPKNDDDYSDTINFYVFDKKTKKEVKIYTEDEWNKDKKENIPPQKFQNVVVDNLSGEMPLYQQRQCKKEFLKFANETNGFFNVKNYWVMELANLTIHTHYYMYWQEWDIHRIFCRHEKFRNIWVPDWMEKGEEPFFMYIDEHFSKVATFRFRSPEYHITGIYKRGMAKAKIFEPDFEFLKEMTEFLNAPAERLEETSFGGPYYEAYKKYVKNNWQQLIFEYNHNTIGWGWGKNSFVIPPKADKKYLSNVSAIPFDLPIPDYLKLAKENL